MADVYIAEFEHVVSVDGTLVGQMLAQPPLARQKIAIGASTQSAAFNAKTRAVLLTSDGAYHYAFGEAPTASATTDYMPSATPWVFAVIPGQKIAVAT